MSNVRHKKAKLSIPSLARKYRVLSLGLQLRLDPNKSIRQRRGYEYVLTLLSRLDEEFDRRDNKINQLQDALGTAIIALDDWTRTIAPEFCDEDLVAETEKRLSQDGSLHYIATVLDKCKESLK